KQLAIAFLTLPRTCTSHANALSLSIAADIKTRGTSDGGFAKPIGDLIRDALELSLPRAVRVFEQLPLNDIRAIEVVDAETEQPHGTMRGRQLFRQEFGAGREQLLRDVGRVGESL